MPVKKDSNPKDAMGVKKVSVHVVPMQVVGEVALAFTEGGRKYGSHNYRDVGVRASTYVNAVWRHVFLQWWEGEDIDKDSGLNHITKAIASLFVLRDSMMMGNWVDDRPINSEQMCKEFNEKAAEIIEKYPDCAEPFTEARRLLEEENKPKESSRLSGAKCMCCNRAVEFCCC